MPILRKTLRDLRWQIIWYGAGIGAYAALIVLLYPFFQETFAELELPEGYASFLGGDAELDLSTPRGYMTTEMMSWVPLVGAMYAVFASTSLFGSDEQDGTLELLLTQPISRRRLFVERVGGLVIATLLIGALAATGIVIGSLFVDLGDLGALQLAGAMFNLVPLMLACAGLGLLVATLTPTRGLALALVAGETVVVFLLNSISNLNGTLEPLRYLSPFYYSDSATVLHDGIAISHLLMLFGAFLLLTALAARSFDAREIGARRWQLRSLIARNV